jgi:AcrR family transcriptional regulator
MEALSPRPARARRRAASAARADNARNVLTPAHWIEAATELLVDGGVDLVRVDVVAKALEVTRGSFYWHFKDRDDLLARVLESWRAAATEQVINRFEGRGADPRERLAELLTLPFRGQSAERAARIELAIRDWARRNATARRAVDEVDERRIGYTAQCFSALGFDIAEARSRAFILYGYQVAESLLRRQGAAAQQRERCALLERLLLTPAPAVAPATSSSPQ